MRLMERSSPAAVEEAGSVRTADESRVAATDERPRRRTETVRTGTDLPGVAYAWSALQGDGALLERVSCRLREELLPARLPALELARATVAVCSLAAAELSSLRAGASGSGASSAAGRCSVRVPSVRIDDGAVATAFTSERHMRTDGRAPATFAPLSRFWPTADGWLRTHANYPHHRARLLSALGIAREGRDETAVAEAVAAELAQRHAAEVEETVYAAGGLAVAVRSPEEWEAHPQGARFAGQPLVRTALMDQAPPLPLTENARPGALRSVRVLDLTRVIAGPVATRTLALLGADVLRIDTPQLPESPDTHADTGPGKRSTLLDLSSRADQATFEELLSAADVVVTGYRPGALDRFGLAPESMADRRPGVIVGQINAWGPYGPWRTRRGFDSLVQAASGIAVTESQRTADRTGEETPGVLPAQVLDHGTGYLLAAAVLRALTEQRRGRCGSRLVRLALAQTADWLQNGLTSAPRDEPALSAAAIGRGTHDLHDPHDPAPWLNEADSPLGRLRYALPPVAYDGAPDDWSAPPGVPGADPAAWW
jgi:crotonobetainyl-CoA:carnitine CoA-transferase CaiB-like acyl-CoA transferase